MIGLSLSPTARAVQTATTVNQTRYLPTFDGVGMFALFASAIVGNGQGEIVLKIKLSDVGNAPFYLVDGVDESNRPYVYKAAGNTSISSLGGLDVSVDTGDNTISYGVVAEYKITGNFNDLEIGRLLARFSDAEFAKCQPIFFSFKDGIGTPQQRQVEFDFLLDKPQGYILPVGEKPSRNLVTQNAVTTWDGTESDWASKDLGLTLRRGKVYQVRVRPGKGSVNNIRFAASQFNGAWTPVSLNGEAQDYIWSPDSDRYVAIQTQFGSDKFIGTVEVEVREVSNALILKGLPANIANVFEAVVQRGDGHYEGKNAWDWDNATTAGVGDVSIDGRSAVFNIDGTDSADIRSFDALEVGESYFYGAAIADYVSGNIAMASASWQVHDIESGSFEGFVPSVTTTAAIFSRSGADCKYRVTKPYYKRAVKLSAHLLKLHQIQQIKGAIDAYWAKNKSFHLVDPDGVDDHVVLGPIALNGDFEIQGEAVRQVDTAAVLGGAAGLTRLYFHSSGNIELANSSAANWVGAMSSVQVGEFFTWKLIRTGGIVELLINEVSQGLRALADALNVGFVARPQVQNNYYNGGLINIVVIDCENPLPIGAGGNSGFWPLDGSTAIAEQKLGVDSKGKIIAKDGAGLGLELWLKGDYSSTGSESAYGVIANEQGMEAGKTVQYRAVISDLESGRYNLVVGTQTVTFASNGVHVGLITANSSQFLSQIGNVLPNVGAKLSLSVKEVHGFGEWQGLSADLSEIQPVTRNADGALLGDGFTIPLSAELQRQHDLAIIQNQINKQLAKVEKSHANASLDRVDDFIDLPIEWQAYGAFDIYTWVKPQGADANGIMWGDDSKFARSTGGAILTRGPDGDLVTGPRLNDDLYHLLKLSYDETNSYLELDGRSIMSAAGLRVPNKINRYGYYHAGLFLGHLGPLILIDKKNPKNSRFYVHDKAAGKMVDVLHPDGSMDGNYTGLSADLSEIQSFNKKGDDWISSDQLTTIKGA